MGKLAAHGILTRKDIIEEIGVTDTTLTRWEEEYGFPCRTIGRTTFYDIDAIKRWIAEKPAKQVV